MTVQSPHIHAILPVFFMTKRAFLRCLAGVLTVETMRMQTIQPVFFRFTAVKTPCF